MSETAFVARQQALNRLDGFLSVARTGKTQICFITGEAGTGKSALLNEFVRRAQLAWPDMGLGLGVCNSQLGNSDPLLPFRNILVSLVGDSGQTQTSWITLAMTLLNEGRDLLDIFDLCPTVTRATDAHIQRMMNDAPEESKVALQRLETTRTLQAHFRTHLINSFSLDELRTLGLDLGVDLENLPGEVKEAKARELITFLDRRKRLGELVALCRGQRPNVVWPQVASMPGEALASDTLHVQNREREQLFEIRDRLRLQTDAAFGIRLAPDRNRIFSQYLEVMRAITQHHPLVLALDDLQWVDATSADLFFHLARSLKQSRLLLMGTYRPSEVGTEKHPLKQVMSELRRSFNDIEINLDEIQAQERREFVDALIDAEPNRLDPSFRSRLFAKTEGHALFTQEIWHDMKERGALRQDGDGYWVASPSLNWDDLPQGVEDAIETRLNRLPDDLREILDIGSVEGQNFTAQVIGRIQQDKLNERRLMASLSKELERRYALVHEGDELQLGKQVLTRYHFAHALFQEFLYSHLSQGTRRVLHHDVGLALEMLAEDGTAEIAAQLARHFVASKRDDDKAVTYLIHVGDHALRVSAFAEALTAFEQALDLLLASASPDENVVRCTVLLRLGSVHEKLGAYVLAGQLLQGALRLAEGALNKKQMSEALSGLCLVAYAQGKFDEAQAFGEQALALAHELANPDAIAYALRTLGTVVLDQGNHALATEYLEESLKIYRELSDPVGIVICLTNLGTLAGEQNDYVTSSLHFKSALAVAKFMGDRLRMGLLLGNLGVDAEHQADDEAATRYYEEALTIATQIGDQVGSITNQINLGDIAVKQNKDAVALDYYKQALTQASHIEALSWGLESLRGIANIFTHNGEWVRAAELVGLVLNHPASDSDTKVKAQDLLNQLRSALQEDDLNIAFVRSQTISFQDVAKNLIATSFNHNGT